MSKPFNVTTEIALEVLPILREFAARQLTACDETKRAGLPLALQLKTGRAGGLDLESFGEYFPGDMPPALNDFWKTMMAFEDMGLGGFMSGGVMVRPSTSLVELDSSMLSQAAGAIEQLSFDGYEPAASAIRFIEPMRSIRRPAANRLAA